MSPWPGPPWRSSESEILVLDDGFQHRRLARDLDLVLIDATAPWGYGYLLPRGLLREPPSSLRRASVVVLTRCDQVERPSARAIAAASPARWLPACRRDRNGASAGGVGQQRADDDRRWTCCADRPVAAFCGLGNPEAFRRTLTRPGRDRRGLPRLSRPSRLQPRRRGRTCTPGQAGAAARRRCGHDAEGPGEAAPDRAWAAAPLWALRIRLRVELDERPGRCCTRRSWTMHVLATDWNGNAGSGQKPMKPFDLHGLKTYELRSRPSKVFDEDLGQPVDAERRRRRLARRSAAAAGRQRAAPRPRSPVPGPRDGRTVVAALGGHVIKTGCAPYLIDWIQQRRLKAVAMNGSAAIHDFELALAGKTSEDVAASCRRGQFGMARETADAFAVAARAGAENDMGLGWRPGPLPRRHRLPATPTAAWSWPPIAPAFLARPRRPRHRHRPHAPARLRRGPGRSVADRFPPAVQRRRHACSTASG